jgi:hypothetical protein
MKYYTSLMIFHTMKDLGQVVDAVKSCIFAANFIDLQ